MKSRALHHPPTISGKKPILRVGGILLIVASTLAGVYALGRGSASAKAALKENKERVTSSTTNGGEIARLSDALSRTEQRLESLESASARPAAEPGREEKTKTPPPPSREEIERRQAERVEMIEDAIQMEPRDASWAPGYEEQIREAIQKAGDGRHFNVKTLACKTSVCKMEVSHADQQEQLAFLQGLQMNLPEATATHMKPVQGSDGSFSTIAHFIRTGYPIPGAEARD
jgi:hypothetical protein